MNKCLSSESTNLQSTLCRSGVLTTKTSAIKYIRMQLFCAGELRVSYQNRSDWKQCAPKKNVKRCLFYWFIYLCIYLFFEKQTFKKKNRDIYD